MKNTWVGAFAALCLVWPVLGEVAEPEPGESVVVVFNPAVPGSRGVAEHYARQRRVPARQVIGLELPKTESLTRKEFRENLQEPLMRQLLADKLFVERPGVGPVPKEKLFEVPCPVSSATVRYLALCHGVPLKIAADPRLGDEGFEKMPPEFRRNEAAVDSELALLPLYRLNPPVTGPFANRHFGVSNNAAFHPTNGLLMVTRLDGPTPEIARALVDKAMAAEKDGLWGRAYFDARGLTNTSYKLGDDWIKAAAQYSRGFGFETVLDDTPGTFPPSYPMSRIALYAGWYDWDVSGPFTRGEVEFAPGAFAYHLHSFSASTIRSFTKNWVGPLLAKGATITMGCVEEPYLEGTPDIAAFLWFFLRGYTFGEAAYACQKSLSWQTTVVGDPLYCPFRKGMQRRYEELSADNSSLIEWADLMIVNRNLFRNAPIEEAIGYLEKSAAFPQSAVLREKLGDIHGSKGRLSDSVEQYLAALKLNPSPQQFIRLSLNAAKFLAALGRGQEAYDVYKGFFGKAKDYPDMGTVYRKALPFAARFGSPEEVAEIRRQIEWLDSK